MADDANDGPAIAEHVSEVQAVFPSDAALQDAIARLTQTGHFDRADLSMPTARPATQDATPDQGADLPTTDTDVRQARTLGTSMAGTVGAIAAAGATIGTGGAAGGGIAPAAAAGAGAGAMAGAAGTAAKNVQHDSREESAERGELVLSVRIIRAGNQQIAESAMRAAGATRVAAVTRADAGIQSAGWTG